MSIELGPESEQRLAAARARRAERLGAPLPKPRPRRVRPQRATEYTTTHLPAVKPKPKTTPTERARRSKKKRSKRKGGWDTWSTRSVYGNTVIRPWRRNNSGGWSRS